jgi:hypothetical protein
MPDPYDTSTRNQIPGVAAVQEDIKRVAEADPEVMNFEDIEKEYR